MSTGERTGRNRSHFEDTFVRTDFCGQRSYSSIDCFDYCFDACILPRQNNLVTRVAMISLSVCVVGRSLWQRRCLPTGSHSCSISSFR